MKTKFLRQKKRDVDDALPSLNTAINALDLARDTTSVKQARDVFGSASALLTATRVGFLLVHVGRWLADVTQDSAINEVLYVELALACVDVCQTLDRATKESGANQLSRSVLSAIDELTM